VETAKERTGELPGVGYLVGEFVSVGQELVADLFVWLIDRETEASRLAEIDRRLTDHANDHRRGGIAEYRYLKSSAGCPFM
jgi:hypothetical protein